MPGKKIISFLVSLHQKKYRQSEGLFFAEGRKIITELIQSEFPVQQVYGSAQLLEELSVLEGSRGVLLEEISPAELKKISALSNPQDGFALCKIPFNRFNDFRPGGLYLYLDGIRDPGNLGSLIRLADWFGVDALVCSPDCVEWTNPKVIQASMASFIRKIPIIEEDDFWDTLPPDVRIVAADLEGEELYRGFQGFAGMFVISNEANGLSNRIEGRITQKVHIPTPVKSAESLNAANAAAVLLGELSRRRFWIE